MRVASWNVNGMRAVARTGSLKAFIKDIQPDVLCLQEVRAHRHQAPFDHPHYFEYWNSADRAGYAGTAILTRQKPLAVMHDLPPAIEAEFRLADDPIGNPNREGRAIAIELATCWIASLYAPNTKRDLSRLSGRCESWEPAVLAWLKGLEHGAYGTGIAKPVIFTGDLNVAHQEIDLARPKQNRRTHGFTDEERSCFQALIDAGYLDTFRTLHPDRVGAYTWWAIGARERNIGWRIDYIMASEALLEALTSATIHDRQLGSDHVPVSADFTLG